MLKLPFWHLESVFGFWSIILNIILLKTVDSKIPFYTTWNLCSFHISNSPMTPTNFPTTYDEFIVFVLQHKPTHLKKRCQVWCNFQAPGTHETQVKYLEYFRKIWKIILNLLYTVLSATNEDWKQLIF